MKRTSMSIRIAALAAIALTASAARAQITIDGTADAAYGAALSVQNTNTHFGNNENPDPIVNSGGSEIDQLFATVVGDRLYVTIAGNLEANFNKMEVYIDSAAGGFNTIDGSQLPTGVDGYSANLNGGDPPNLPDPANGALQRQNGLTFDAGFAADYYLTFTRGGENTGASLGYADGTGFYALTAHYADLQGGTGQSLGMQLGPQGMPNVLRGPLAADFNNSSSVDGGDFLIWQRNLGLTPADKLDGDANDDDVVDGADLGSWQDLFGDAAGLDDYAFNPGGGFETAELIGPALPNLNQGDLIDQTYATTHGTDGGTGQLLARELAFVLPPDAADPDNELNRRDMENTVDLKVAYDDSNVGGVSGDAPYTTATTEDPTTVTTGLEFSIPLSEIGSPTAGGDIRIVAFVNNGNHNYASNQFAGTGILDGNIGQDSLGGFISDDNGFTPAASLANTYYAGDQFVTLTIPGAAVTNAAVPEPATLALAGVALGLLAVQRRRR